MCVCVCVCVCVCGWVCYFIVEILKYLSERYDVSPIIAYVNLPTIEIFHCVSNRDRKQRIIYHNRYKVLASSYPSLGNTCYM